MMNQVSLVEQLKEVVKAQNESLRHKEAEIKKLRAENARLVARVRLLECEKEDLKARWDKYQEKFHNSTKEGKLKTEVTSSESTPNNSGLSHDTSSGELYITALTSPMSPNKTSATDSNNQITITLSSTPNSPSRRLSSVKNRETLKKTLGRSESRKSKRKSFYELSPDISDKHVQVLENCYGGKLKANHAARIIQQHYRSWAMKRAYFRLRTQSEVRRTSIKGSRSKRNSAHSRTSSEDMSPISNVPATLNFSLDAPDTSLAAIDGKNPGSPRTKPETESSLARASTKEFKAIQTDINIDENFQPVEASNTGPHELSVRHMSEDISSIEISKNLLNDSIGQKMIIDQVFQEIISQRKDSISLGGRQNRFRSFREEKIDIVVDSAVESEPVGTLESEEPNDELGERNEPVKEEEGKKQSMEEEKGEVCEKEEKPVEKQEMDSNENLPVTEENAVELGKFPGSSDIFDAVDGHSYSWPTLNQLNGEDTYSMGGNSLSPSSSIIQTFYEDKEKDIRIGINHFNRKPKTGISYLFDSGVLEDDPDSVCKFLKEEPGINKQKVGEYLGDLRNPFSMEVLQSFVRSIDIEGKEVDEALRYFQTFFRMPGEAQKIERLVMEFSAAYVEANPGRVSDNPDTILILSFAIIMLNTDLHSPNVKRKMSKEQFIQNLRGTDNGEDLPYDTLSNIYDRVQKKQFKTGPDNLDAILKYEKQILGKVPWTTLALPHRQLRQVTSLYEIQGGRKKEKPHPRVVFLFSDMMVVTKERGQAGQKGIHFYSYKSSYPLCDIKFSLFNNNYYKYGIRLLNKSNNEALISFNAKKEDIRKVFYTELRDCIEETTIMESERINSEKTRQMSVLGYSKKELEDTISLTLPRSHSQNGKVPPDSLSLVNEPSILTDNELTTNRLMSTSLQDLSLADGGGFYEENLQKSSSVMSFDLVGSVSTENVWSHYQSSSGSIPELPLDIPHHPFPKKFGLFSSKRAKHPSRRKLAKSTGSLEDIKIHAASSSSPKQRKSEFFVKSPIAT